MSNQNGWIQEIFNPVAYYFTWTNSWYEWDSGAAAKKALEDRNKRAKELKEEGYKVSKFSLKGQLITRGGIGTNHPQVEFFTNCYGLNAFK